MFSFLYGFLDELFILCLRRNLMKPGGLVLPDFAELHVAGVDDRDYLSSSKQRWESAVPGFDLSPVMTQVRLHCDFLHDGE